MNNKIIIIGGPTATGKTDVAIKIAKEVNGELINADSRQIYRFLDIGTNKGKFSNTNNRYYIEGIPIHLINILNPNERFSVYEFKQDALEKIRDISSRGKVPIVVGGTGLYIDSLLKDYSLNESNKDIDFRKKLDSLDINQLKLLAKLENPVAFTKLNNSDANNPRRLIRLIEKSNEIVAKSGRNSLKSIFIYPNYKLDELKEKINNRVDEMFESGIIEETKEILGKGYSKDSDGLRIMGYRQVIDYLDKKINLEVCIELVKIAHKQYAKRQKTWFEGKGRGYDLIKYSNVNEAVETAKRFLE